MKAAFFYFNNMDLTESFKKAAENIHSLDYAPSKEDLLKMYGLYKQATEGDETGDRPGGFDFKAIAKYDSWASLKGMQKEEAMRLYIDLVNSLFD